MNTKKKTTHKKVKKKIVKSAINWHQIISLSAAGHYIAERLNEELKKVESRPFKSEPSPTSKGRRTGKK